MALRDDLLEGSRSILSDRGIVVNCYLDPALGFPVSLMGFKDNTTVMAIIATSHGDLLHKIVQILMNRNYQAMVLYNNWTIEIHHWRERPRGEWRCRIVTIGKEDFK